MAIQSPFPGMDPWLEAHWGDVHSALVTYIRDAVQGHLPPTLRARMEERVFLEYDPPQARQRGVYPDVRVVEYPRHGGAATAAAPTLVAAKPLKFRFRDEPITQTYIEIIDVGSGNRVITIIEVLSPSNKHPGPGQREYLRKQAECQAGKVNLVEIDLLRRGQRVTSLRPDDVGPNHQTPYAVVVWRASDPDTGELYPIPLRERLPAIGVPLRETDSDVVLDLQILLDQAYRNGRYDTLDYRRDPDPPLEGEDAVWANDLLRQKGLRA